MNQALTVRRDASIVLPSGSKVPTLSPSLTYLVGYSPVLPGTGSAEDGNGAHYSTTPPPVPSDADLAEAKAAIGAATRMCRTRADTAQLGSAFGALVDAWVRRLIPNLPKGPSSNADVAKVVDGIMLACQDLPLAVWTEETVAAALKTFEWWPQPKKVLELLQPYADRLTGRRAGLERVIASAVRPAAPTRTDERDDPAAQAHVKQVVAGFMAERSFNDPARREGPSKVKPAYGSDGALLQEYEALAAQGNTAAGVRAAILRKRLAEQARGAQ